MELKGEHRIPAPREVVWQALHDADILKDCIKGCEKFEFVADNEIVAKVKAKVGPVSATFDADVFIENQVAPESYTLRGEGKGGVAGFAKGHADVHLAEDGTDTVLTYHTKANVGGKLAQLGSRLVDSTAKKYAADFFEKLSQKLSTREVEEPATTEPAAGAGTPAPSPVEASPAEASPEEGTAATHAAEGTAAEADKGGGGTVVWVLVALAVAVGAAALFALS